MAEVIRMPEVLAGAAEAAIQTWLTAPGSVVAADQPLAEIETDKAIVEFSAETAGIVGRLLAAEGDSVAVGDPILVLLAEGEGEGDIEPALEAAGVTDAAADSSASAPVPEAAPVDAPAAAEPPDVTPETASPSPGVGAASSATRLFASPIVRKLAVESGVDLISMQGTGPNGRIVRRDLERHLAQGRQAAAPARAEPEAAAPARPTPTSPPESAPSAGYEVVPIDRMRRAIARRLTESKSTVPHFYLVADCRVDALLDLRAEVNASSPRKVSINDVVLKAVAGALMEVPAANAVWDEEGIRRYSSVDLAVAVATEGGLITPVLRAVERMPLGVVSSTVAELAERARGGRLRQHELEGGSFAVSNLGMYGTSEFSAILNPPQSGILAVGAARTAAVVGDDGQLTVGTVMTVTLSADHRVMDGAVAAEWLAAFQRRIEHPLTALI